MEDETEVEFDISIDKATAEELVENVTSAIEEEKITAYLLASHIMEEYAPSFVLIGSPQLRVSDNGYVFPAELGVSMNGDLDITPSVLASILFHTANELSDEVRKVSNFIYEATHPEEEDE